MGHPTIYPTGATLYDPARAWSGYTVFPSAKGALLIDMRGHEVNLWPGTHGFPDKILPGGFVLTTTGQRDPKRGYMDGFDLVQLSWDGDVVWRFHDNEAIDDPGLPFATLARQHHDHQREGSTVGYFAPGAAPRTDGGTTLILVHQDVEDPRISDKPLLDDRIIEVTWEGETVWEWRPVEHFAELDFDETARNALFRDPALVGTGRGDWLHLNCVSTLGPNPWHDAGDERFHPDNIIWDARNANILAIVSKATGRVVWRVGPDFSATPELRQLGWIIGQHHLHMIPAGLPGAGNLLVFDNGGWGGYGAPSGLSRYGFNSQHRAWSRVVELNPQTLEVVWEHTARSAGWADRSRFYSPYVSSAQRLPNGNTLLTEGSDGRLIEVTAAGETVWEYINPYYSESLGGTYNMVYRAYRVPYDWIPQLPPPQEEAIVPPDNATYRVAGSPVGADPANEVWVS
ncbi:MAG: aryl-sulfate sulfotransferase [Propionibacteriaceae bacterium]|jgi:hypothetical protein|nr:aryl-sulfate sulfotransferase [Propionibacteriaceae bacterium]